MPDSLQDLKWAGTCRYGGRIQSREYVKKLDDQSTEKRVAYEVSVSKLEYLE